MEHAADRALLARETISKLAQAGNLEGLRALGEGLPATVDFAYERRRARALALALEGRVDQAVAELSMGAAAVWPHEPPFEADLEELRGVSRRGAAGVVTLSAPSRALRRGAAAAVAPLRAAWVSDERVRVVVGAAALAVAVLGFLLLPQVTVDGDEEQAAPRLPQPNQAGPKTVRATPGATRSDRTGTGANTARPAARSGEAPARLISRIPRPAARPQPAIRRSRVRPAPVPRAVPPPSTSPTERPVTPPAPAPVSPASPPEAVSPPAPPAGATASAAPGNAASAASSKRKAKPDKANKQKPDKGKSAPGPVTATAASPEPAGLAAAASSAQGGPPGQEKEKKNDPPGQDKDGKKK